MKSEQSPGRSAEIDLDRRRHLRRAAQAGALVWTVPVVTVLTPTAAWAQAGTPPPGQTTTTTTTTSTTTSTTSTTEPPEVRGISTTTTPTSTSTSTTTRPAVGDTGVVRPRESVLGSRRRGSLPRTGVEIEGMLEVAAAALAAGAGLEAAAQIASRARTEGAPSPSDADKRTDGAGPASD